MPRLLNLLIALALLFSLHNACGADGHLSDRLSSGEVVASVAVAMKAQTHHDGLERSGQMHCLQGLLTCEAPVIAAPHPAGSNHTSRCSVEFYGQQCTPILRPPIFPA